MYIYELKNKGYISLFICLALAVIAAACFFVEAPAMAAEDSVNFNLKLTEDENPALEVTLEFRVEENQEVLLVPGWEYPGLQDEDALYLYPLAYVSPALTIESFSEDIVSVEPAPEGETGWVVKGIKSGRASIVYRWQELNKEAAVPDTVGPDFADNPGGYEPSVFPVIEHDIKIFKASDVLMCPRNYPDDSDFTFENYTVSADFRDDETLFVPWKLNKEGNGFEVEGADKLLENFIAWGVIDEVTVQKEKPEVVAGFSTDYQRLTDEEKEKYAEDIGLLYEDLSNNLGPNKGVERVVVVLCGAKRFSLFSPSWDTLQSSTVIFHGGKSLDGEPSVASAGALFDLWNGYAFVPAPNGDSRWFEEGMSQYYPLHVANSNGLLGEETAFEMLSEIYLQYVESNQNMLKDPEDYIGYDALSYGGAILCASIDKRIIDETGGEKDINWLVSEISKDYPHFEGKDYGLSDIVKILDDGAGKGWQQFLNQNVVEEDDILVSEFTYSNLFKKRSTVKAEGSANNTRNWILLGVAVLVILSMPLIFSSYVRRAVKLDVKMPKIIPDDDWDDDKKEKSDPTAEAEKNSDEPVISGETEDSASEQEESPGDKEDGAGGQGESSADSEEKNAELEISGEEKGRSVDTDDSPGVDKDDKGEQPESEDDGSEIDDSDIAVDDGITLEDPMGGTRNNKEEH